MIKEICVPIEDLLLDPNNPRFIRDLNQPVKVPVQEIEKAQEILLERFRSNRASEDPDFDVTNIKDLYDSMLRIGFVGIDQIVVRPLKNLKNKYLVIEGNRRIATIKCLHRDYKDRRSPLDSPRARECFESHESSFKKITAMLLDIEKLTDEQVDEKVAILLGIRHHGSLLEWDPLPKAFNIYTEYMEEKPVRKSVLSDHKKAVAVANRLCIKDSDVTSALRTYVAYLQARERFHGVQDDHYSLLEYAIKDRHLESSYFTIDLNTFKLDEKSLVKLNMVCQFATRDSRNPERTTDNKKKIVRDPKQFKQLGRLISRMQCADHPAVNAYAAGLIRRAEDEKDVNLTLDQAVDALTAFENRTKWAEAVAALFDKQENDLSLDKYAGDGLDRARKDQLKATLETLRKIMAL